MKQIQIQYHKTPCTEFILGSFEGKICLLDYRYREKRETIDRRIQKGLDAVYVEQDNPLLQETRKALDEYFAGKRKTFGLPLLTVGTPFQIRVWEALQKIPYGATVTYAQLAKEIGRPEAVRAVANAVGANALAIIIPCHRIVGSDGTLTGYAGGLALKQRVLDIETIL
ncbi:methylated-DNA--[protein]-cysteine S-methyltransferase [Sulfurovum sp.]|jgi:methylated-DNA-[protein]-cysteine S-methyltransferase|uniref:methylated-DNA--[protein]-cysteine S-methyltransferase n=1 Tax=Sulfurovum sp. TaxID=1969726 RepID=UPI002A372645|nr:methylated-DNA--[protein]-cysteine S-methyltransferase [Sulfurovum sp.]MDD3592062.1 methylated-DNA--[protein]-cysteine S-methyltransferase [Sulfurovum sp.]MDY0402362.1 methylated-DNA--[protein]-cysteine S-methyltransferase [Sulfurovum sp.]